MTVIFDVQVEDEEADVSEFSLDLDLDLVTAEGINSGVTGVVTGYETIMVQELEAH